MKILIASLVVTGCAGTQGMSMLPRADRPMHVELAIDTKAASSDEAQAWFPELASEPTLPSARPLRTALLATGHDRFEIGVRVCVAPDGAVSHVDLNESSGIAELDESALRDIAAWRYERFPGPGRLQTCKPLMLRYTPR